jgi:CDP-glucose 4,6-dehydratase
MKKKQIKNYFKGKKILITGHTGFKGSWLSLWMYYNGANVLGISDKISTKPSHFELLNLKNKISSQMLDITDLNKLKKIFSKFNPDYVFHLAAQSIVKVSYTHPIKTWKTNLIGTVNILECLRLVKKKTVAVMITSDKAYKNLEIKRGYVENDTLKGNDPYGASKSSADIAINSYYQSFFSKKNSMVLIAIARAGNVIGGGDWSPNRIVPDCVKAWSKNKIVIIRNPKSTRPWQHVLDIIYGYMKLAIKLKQNPKLHGEAFNFGPDENNFRVIDVLSKMKIYWPKITWMIKNQNKFKENNLLHLNSNKSKKTLKWKTVLNFSNSVKFTVEWYKHYLRNKKNIHDYSLKQISKYLEILKKTN